jgi:integrase
VRVRRRFYRGTFAPPKSRHGRRDIPLSESLARELGTRSLQADDEDALVFPSERGTVLDASNLMGRVLKPAAVNAGLGEWVVSGGRRTARTWVGFHTFRHTCATMLFRSGLNAKQAQMWLGHHSPAFTLGTYVHLLPDDLPDVSVLDRLAGNVATPGATSPAETGREAGSVERGGTLHLAGDSLAQVRSA